jgi:hypothetical protein
MEWLGIAGGVKWSDWCTIDFRHGKQLASPIA